MHFLAFTTYTKLVTDVLQVSLEFAQAILEFLQEILFAFGNIYFFGNVHRSLFINRYGLNNSASLSVSDHLILQEPVHFGHIVRADCTFVIHVGLVRLFTNNAIGEDLNSTCM